MSTLTAKLQNELSRRISALCEQFSFRWACPNIIGDDEVQLAALQSGADTDPDGLVISVDCSERLRRVMGATLDLAKKRTLARLSGTAKKGGIVFSISARLHRVGIRLKFNPCLAKRFKTTDAGFDDSRATGTTTVAEKLVGVIPLRTLVHADGNAMRYADVLITRGVQRPRRLRP